MKTQKTVHMQNQVRNNVRDIMRHNLTQQMADKSLDTSFWLGLLALTFFISHSF